MTNVDSSAPGLDGLVVAQTRLSDVDGERGRLIIAGHDVEQLALRASFEEVCALLWQQDDAPHALRARLGQARARAFALLPKLGDALSADDPMDALRAATAHVPASEDPNGSLTGAMAVFTAAISRARAGKAPIAPDPTLPHAHDLLRMMQAEASEPAWRALETYLITVIDHGMNASTFTARVVASTGSDAVSAIVAALGALKGPLHGGAPGPVLDMLDAIGHPDSAEEWLSAELAAGRRIMGMGHRVYRVRDPRASVLEKALLQLEAHTLTSSGRLPLAHAVERAAEKLLRTKYPNRPLRANVEFYTATLLDTIGLPRAMFTPAFATGRVAGWCAHVTEQQTTGRLIRPSSRYIGAMPATA